MEWVQGAYDTNSTGSLSVASSYFSVTNHTGNISITAANPLSVKFIGCRNSSSNDNTNQIIFFYNETSYKLRVWNNQFIFNGKFGVSPQICEIRKSFQYTIGSNGSSRISLFM